MKKIALLLLLIIAGGCINLPTLQIFQNVPLQPNKEYTQYSVTLRVSPTTACVGDIITGTIESNIPNGLCTIFVNPNNNGWQIFSNVNLDAAGGYTQSTPIMTAGTAQFRAVCGDGMNWRTSNLVSLIVRTCGTTTTVAPADKYYCCLAMGVQSCYKSGCPPAGVKISEWNTQADCQNNCGPTASTTTTTLSTVQCTAKWPKPMTEKDCSSRTGCSKYEICSYKYDLLNGNMCYCRSKWEVTTSTTTTMPWPTSWYCCEGWYTGYRYCQADSCGTDETVSIYNSQAPCQTGCTTTTTTTTLVVPNCMSICNSNGYGRFLQNSEGYSDTYCHDTADLYCYTHGGLYSWDVISTFCCCYNCVNPA